MTILLAPLKARSPSRILANDQGSDEIDAAMSPGSHLSQHPRFKHHDGLIIILDVTMMPNPCALSALDASVDIAGPALAKATSPKHRRYKGKFQDTHGLVPLAASTGGDYSVDAVVYGSAQRNEGPRGTV